MSRSRYLILVAGLFLGVSFLIFAHGQSVFADEWDYSGNAETSLDWSIFNTGFDFSTQPPYPNWGNETYYAPEVIQDPYHMLQSQDSSPVNNKTIFNGYNSQSFDSTQSDPQSYQDYLSPFYDVDSNVIPSVFSPVEANSVELTVVPPENNLFKRIFGWNLTDEQPAPPKASIVLANNEYTDLQLPPGWGVPITRTDAYTRALLVGGGSGSDTKSQDSSDTVAGGYLNAPAYRSPGPQSYTAETSFSPKGIVMNAINYVKDFMIGGSANNVNVTDVGLKKVEVEYGSNNFLSLQKIPGGVFLGFKKVY